MASPHLRDSAMEPEGSPSSEVLVQDPVGSPADGGPSQPVRQPYRFVRSAPKGGTSNQPVRLPDWLTQSGSEESARIGSPQSSCVPRKSGTAGAGGPVITGGPAPRRGTRDLCPPNWRARILRPRHSEAILSVTLRFSRSSVDADQVDLHSGVAEVLLKPPPGPDPLIVDAHPRVGW
jgi:hypothetical protein